jgi:predicted transcriptional regulator
MITHPTTIELKTLLTPEALERLQAIANDEQTTLEPLVREALEHYFELEDENDEEPIEDTPDEVILESLRRALEDMAAGRTRPAQDVLAELRARREKLLHETD